MNDLMRRILESKRGARKRLAALPVAETLKWLEKTRDRELDIGASPLKRKAICNGFGCSVGSSVLLPSGLLQGVKHY